MDRTPLPCDTELPQGIRTLRHYQKHDLVHESFGRDVTALISDIKVLRKPKSRRTLLWVLRATTALLIVIAITVAHITLPPHLSYAGVPLKSAEIQVTDVDDFMKVWVNDQLIEDANINDTPPWRSIKGLLKKGPNSIMVRIDNGIYGGCGGTLSLRINGSVAKEFSRTWQIPIDKAPYNGKCIQEVLTLNLQR